MNNQQQLNFDVSQIPDTICSVCGSKHFIPAYVVKKVSALISPNGQESFINIPVLVCLNCKTNIQDMLEVK